MLVFEFGDKVVPFKWYTVVRNSFKAISSGGRDVIIFSISQVLVLMSCVVFLPDVNKGWGAVSILNRVHKM